jgi:APA family basic amino acid/polyamine antiporter
MAGNALWSSFLIAAIIASFTGLSYAELTSIFPKDAGEYIYVKESFGRKGIAFIVGWLVLFLGFVSAATVAIGFAGYFSSLFFANIVLSSYLKIILPALGLIFLSSILNFWGIGISTKLNILFTAIEFTGLLLIIFLAFPFLGSVDYTQMNNGFGGILSTAALIFFAYIGFDSIVKMSEETKNPRKILPKALVISIILTTILYILVGLSVVSVGVSTHDLAASDAPMALVASAATSINQAQWGMLLSIIALFATANTVLIILIATSRMAYGMAEERILPPILARVHKIRRTPITAVFLTMGITMLFALLRDLQTVANITNFAAFVLFASVNSSLIWLRYKEPHLEREFKSPINIGKFPVLAFLGLLSSVFMIFQFSTLILLMGTGIIFLGYIFYKVIKPEI